MSYSQLNKILKGEIVLIENNLEYCIMDENNLFSEYNKILLGRSVEIGSAFKMFDSHR